MRSRGGHGAKRPPTTGLNSVRLSNGPPTGPRSEREANRRLRPGLQRGKRGEDVRPKRRGDKPGPAACDLNATGGGLAGEDGFDYVAGESRGDVVDVGPAVAKGSERSRARRRCPSTASRFRQERQTARPG
jgi:hypothetical protein